VNFKSLTAIVSLDKDYFIEANAFCLEKDFIDEASKYQNNNDEPAGG